MRAAGAGSRSTIRPSPALKLTPHVLPAPADVPPDPTLACIKEALEEINVSVLSAESDGSDQLAIAKGSCRDAHLAVCGSVQPLASLPTA